MSNTTPKISGNSSLDTRTRAVRAVIVDGLSMSEVALTYSTNRSTIHRWVSRFKKQGKIGLNRKTVSGRPRKLSVCNPDHLQKIVKTKATEFGFETDFWTIRRLIQVMQSECGLVVSKQTIMRRLHEAGLSYQKPEKRYFESSETAREEWRLTELPKIHETVRKHRAILYFQDEAHISLTAFLGKTWAPKGETPQQIVTGKRGGIAAMSAITASGQLIFQLHDKRITSNEVIDFLTQMLKNHSRRHLVVVMDQAPPHTSKKTQAFIQSQSRLHVFYLPSYSPDWNPDEKVWNHLKHQELKGHQAKTKEELMKLTQTKLEDMSRNKDLVQGIFFRCCMANVLEV